MATRSTYWSFRTVWEMNSFPLAFTRSSSARFASSLPFRRKQTTEKWLYAAGRAPQARTLAATQQILKDAGIPRADWSFLTNFRGKNINNSAGIVLDYRTGQILAYGGSAGYTFADISSFASYDLTTGWKGGHKPLYWARRIG